MKPAMHSNMKPATHSETKPATVPIEAGRVALSLRVVWMRFLFWVGVKCQAGWGDFSWHGERPSR